MTFDIWHLTFVVYYNWPVWYINKYITKYILYSSYPALQGLIGQYNRENIRRCFINKGKIYTLKDDRKEQHLAWVQRKQNSDMLKKIISIWLQYDLVGHGLPKKSCREPFIRESQSHTLHPEYRGYNLNMLENYRQY